MTFSLGRIWRAGGEGRLTWPVGGGLVFHISVARAWYPERMLTRSSAMSSTSVVTCTWDVRRRFSKSVVWLRSSGVECWYNCISWGGTGVIMAGWVLVVIGGRRGLSCGRLRSEWVGGIVTNTAAWSLPALGRAVVVV